MAEHVFADDARAKAGTSVRRTVPELCPQIGAETNSSGRPMA